MRYGAKNAMWAPFEGTEPDAVAKKMPTYGEAKELGGINESNDTINFAEGSAYADNAKKIAIKEFSSGTIAANMLHVPFDLGSEMLGVDKDDEEGRSYSAEDNAPFGGYGFYCTRMDAQKKKYFEVVFYPKVQGSVGNSSYKTKEDNITLEYDALSFDIMAANCGKYKIEKRFSSEEEAVEYLSGLFTGTSAVPGIEGSGIPKGKNAVSVRGQDEQISDLGNTKVSELIGEDVEVKWSNTTGAVTGTVKKKEGLTDFSNDLNLQTGHYFPFALSAQYEGEEVTCIASQEKTVRDRFWTVRLDQVMDTTKQVVFKVKGTVVATLDFSGATMASE